MVTSRPGWMQRWGLIVFIPGTLTNIGEYVLANTVAKGVMLPIIVLALIDAAMIAYFFMHITQLWHSEEH